MRKLDPFGFFAGQASAIAGFGGFDRSADPRYCFHTAYEPVPMGQTAFTLVIGDARASVGELNMRVMALRQGADATMAASLRVDLEGLAEPELRRRIGFTAVDGVEYALYGFLTGEGDLTAASVSVELEESALPDAARSSVRSRFAASEGLVGTGRLYAHAAPSILKPTSQPYSHDQADAIVRSGLWPEIVRKVDDSFVRWQLFLPLQVIANAGMLDAGARGLLLEPPSPLLAQALAERECTIVTPDGGAASQQCDFAIGYALDPALSETAPLPDVLLESLAGGGLGVAVMAIPASCEEADFRNVIQRVALRMIGMGHSVGQIGSVVGQSWIREDAEGGAFALVLRK